MAQFHKKYRLFASYSCLMFGILVLILDSLIFAECAFIYALITYCIDKGIEAACSYGERKE